MIFHKASSFGNDFLVVDGEQAGREAEKGGLARRLCDRRRGVGADGVAYYRRLQGGVRFEIYNQDGGRAELSGNGMAALAAVLSLRRLPGRSGTERVLRSPVGERRVIVRGRSGPVFRLEVEIGRPAFACRSFFPFLRKGGGAYRAAGVEFHPVSVGNPHAVVLCRGKLPAPGRLVALGRKLEGHPLFPRRVNVEFVQRTAPGRCRVFYYERGVGPTQASSTGSAAVFAVLRRLGMAGERLEIEPAWRENPGGGTEDDGPIRLRWQEGIWVETKTRIICKGEYFL